MGRAVYGVRLYCSQNRQGVCSYQFSHQTSGREVALQKHDQIFLREENTRKENYHSWLSSNSFLKGVETGGRKHKTTNVWYKGESINDKRGSGALSKPYEEVEDSVLGLSLLGGVAVGRVLAKVGKVHGPELRRVIGAMFNDIGPIDPVKRFHEPGDISLVNRVKMQYQHVIQGGSEISHQTHQEKRYLKD